MSGRWWRAYSRARHDPKLLKLSDKHFRWWFNLVCVAAENGGSLPPHADLAVEFRVTGAAMTQVLDVLVGAGLLDHDDAGIRPHNWNALQYVSDSSSNRVKQFRERQRNVSVTPSETEAETDTESEKEIVRAFALFNDAAKRTNWPSVSKIDDRRKRRMRDRLKEVGVDGFALVLAKAEGSEFLTEKWPNFNIDWMLKPENFTKLREGNYDNRGAIAQTAGSSSGNETDQWRARLRSYTPGSFWSPMWGPRPGEAGCFVPPAILAEFPQARPQ